MTWSLPENMIAACGADENALRMTPFETPSTHTAGRYVR